MRLVRLFLFLLGAVVVAALAWGIYRTWRSEKSSNQAVFTGGSATLPTEGFYRGSVTGYTGSWQGKNIYDDGSGENVFAEADTTATRYPFILATGTGLRDKSLAVVILDYNQPGNPWWLKFIVDEMVATGPTTYLGKVHVRIAPKLVLTLGYFTLERQ